MKRFLYLDTKNRIFGLDFLRFFAIIFVMITHAGRFFPEVYIDYYTKIIYDGVGIFFVLSGFLIGGILLKQMEVAPFSFAAMLDFWYKRWTRTLPNYYLFLILLLCIPFYSIEKEELYPYFLFLQNMTAPSNDFFNWSWSLSVEEWFYIFIPAIIYILINCIKFTYKKAFLATVILVIIGGIVLRAKIAGGGELDFYHIRYTVIYRLDAIVYGLLGAYIQRYCNDFWQKSKKIGCVLGFLGLGLFYFTDIEQNTFYRSVFSFSVTSLTVLCFLPYLSSMRGGTSFGHKVVTYVSLISYSMYLFNSLISDVLVYAFDWDYWVAKYLHSWAIAKGICFILFWVLTLVLSFINYKYFESVMTKYLRNRIDRKR